MAHTRLLAYAGQPTLTVDPRTKCVLLLTVSTVCLGAPFSGWAIGARLACALLVAALLWCEARWLAGLLAVGATALALWVENAGWALVGSIGDGWGLVATVVTGGITLVARFAPGVLCGLWMLQTTRIGEFVAAMQRARLPFWLIVPFAVVLRYVPVVTDESVRVAQAMSMRGLTLRRVGPTRWLEYRLVPLLTSASTTADDLASAAIGRGLGATRHRTSVATVGFRAVDAACFLVCIGIVVMWSLG